MLSTIPNASRVDHETEVRENKSLCPKEFQQRDIERYELVIRYHSFATIVNLYQSVYMCISFLPDIYSRLHNPFSVKDSQILYALQ